MSLQYSRKNLISISKGSQKTAFIKGMRRPSFEETDDILNFTGYFSGHTLEYGTHGPEAKNEKTYISVYHFMEYNGIDPTKYDTIAIGGHLSTINDDHIECKYKEQSFTINKYNYFFIKENQEVFKTYLK